MAQYIDKDIVIQEMARRIHNLEELGDRQFIATHFPEQYRFIEVYEGIIDFINNSEPKNVDLEKKLSMLDKTLFDFDGVAVAGTTHYLTVGDVKEIAKQFYEYGLMAQNAIPKGDIKYV